jgi:hypothetical protein
MKFVSQIGLAIVAIVGLVAGITYVSQILPEGRTPVSPGTAADTKATDLIFPVRKVEWDPPSAGEVEQETRGYHDFWFQNEAAAPVELGLHSKSCKCSDVTVCLLSPDQAVRIQLVAPFCAVSQIVAGQLGILELCAQVLIDPANSPELLAMRKLDWQKLDPGDPKGVVVEPRGAGMVRLAYEGKKDKVGGELLSVTLWIQAREGRPAPRSFTNLELPVTFVPPVRVLDASLSLDDVNPREEKQVQFMCWSSTRADFPLTVKEPFNDPCVSCAWSPLSAQERHSLNETTKSRVLSGYRVRVLVRERPDDNQQMDLGPFNRRIALTSDAAREPTIVQVHGVVRGEVTVGAEEDKGRIALGTYPARRGVPDKRVKLTSEQPGLELELARIEPEGIRYVRVKSLKKIEPTVDGRTRWELAVEVPPGGPSGKLPEHCAVLLKIPGKTPRHIRIPITGMAYQRSGE